jgi:hypothetical protein
MVRFLPSAGLTLTLCACASVTAFAQVPPLVFTVGTPERTPSETILQASAAVEERGLALWGGAVSDFGFGVALSGSRWTVRSITSMNTLRFGSHDRPTFQQIEIVRPVFSAGSVSVAGGGGIRQEWDGTRVFIGRVLAGSDVGRGRLQGSLVIERAALSSRRRDAADVVTSLGWSRRIGDRIGVGVEGIGRDLEGFWNRAEVDGGAKLLVGPSLHVQSKSGDWAASVIAGPVMHTSSVASLPRPGAATSPYGGGQFGMFASATWVPSLGRTHSVRSNDSKTHGQRHRPTRKD